jgi:hypothetical protein
MSDRKLSYGHVVERLNEGGVYAPIGDLYAFQATADHFARAWANRFGDRVRVRNADRADRDRVFLADREYMAGVIARMNLQPGVSGGIGGWDSPYRNGGR